MAVKVTVTLATKIIKAKPGVTQLDAAVDLYSDLKEDWIANASGELGFAFPFRTVGGDPIGGGLKAGAFFFLQNQDGWRVEPASANHELTIVGNLYPEDTGLPMFLFPSGFTVGIHLEKSSLTQVAGEVVGSAPIAELTAAPPSTPTFRQALAWLFMQTRNAVRTDSGALKQQVHNDAGVLIAEATLSDAASVFTRGKFS